MKPEEIIRKYNLDEKSWTHKGFHGILHFFFPVGEMPLKPLKKYYGHSCSIIAIYAHEDYCDWYWYKEDMKRLRKLFIKKAYDDPKSVNKLLNDWHRRLDKFNNIMRKIDKTNLSKLTDKQLLRLYNEWYDSYLAEYGLAATFQDAFSMHADEFLEPHFRKIIKGNEFNEQFALLTSPVTESFITEEYKDMLKLLKIFKKGNTPSFRNELKSHSDKYHWLHNNYAKDICLDSGYFLRELKKIKKLSPDKELKKLKAEIESIKKDKSVLIKKLKLDNKSRILIKITETFAYMQDERKKYVLMASHYESKFIDEIGKRLKLSRKQMEYTVMGELDELFKKKNIDKNIFQQRKENSFVIFTLKGYEMISGKIAKEIHDKIFIEKPKNIREFKGMTASTGKARGKVKIIKKIYDMINMKKGNVLVSSMTRPEMIVAMKKAAAIVTDEGGVTSHAAVVSRELGIPCIIGTKIATKVLKDGDLVEVDANKGIVRKI